MAEKSIGKAFSQMGVKAKQNQAAARRARVKELREAGFSGPQIAAELGIKLRTVYHDFSVLKREAAAESSESV